MKKQVNLISLSILSTVLVASCSSNLPTTNDVNKVDSVKVSQITQNPTQDNSLKVNVRLMANQPKFGIKATTNAWLSNNVSRVLVKLLKSGVNPGRFDNPLDLAAAGTEKDITGLSPTFGGPSFTVPTPISFNNLKPGNYYVSARAYSNTFNNNSGTLNAAVTGATTITGTGTAWTSAGRNKLFPGDIVSIGPDKYTVLTVPGESTFTIASPGLISGISSLTNYSVETNVTGTGTLGGGMAMDGNQLGGGTASGIATTTSDEEYINVSGTGAVQFMNSGSFNTNNPIRNGVPNQTLDIAIQIMKEYGGSATGAIQLFQGGAPDPETVS